MSDINIRTVNEQDLERCFEIESVSYSGDEAATKDKILKRIKTYPEGFIVLENDKEIIGFINSGIRILMRQNVMRSVAVHAGRRYRQPALKQPFAVNRHRIVFNRILLVDLMCLRHLTALTVAAPAGRGDVHDIGR